MKIYIKIVLVLVAIYVGACVMLYAEQEELIFDPVKLNEHYQFNFLEKFEEVNIKTQDHLLLNGVLFKADSTKGLIFYLHGNSGALDTWGEVAKTYTALHYDVFMPDYRGYGKSEGHIDGEQQFLDDMQITYSAMKKRYPENKMVVNIARSFTVCLSISKFIKPWLGVEQT